MDAIHAEGIRDEVAKRNWYHKIDLGYGIVTPGYDFDSIWNLIRDVRRNVDYKGKRVLDIASWDGMWAFEAEKLGAGFVVAVDADDRGCNFHFCKAALFTGSRSIRTNTLILCNILDYYTICAILYCPCHRREAS